MLLGEGCGPKHIPSLKQISSAVASSRKLLRSSVTAKTLILWPNQESNPAKFQHFFRPINFNREYFMHMLKFSWNVPAQIYYDIKVSKFVGFTFESQTCSEANTYFGLWSYAHWLRNMFHRKLLTSKSYIHRSLAKIASIYTMSAPSLKKNNFSKNAEITEIASILQLNLQMFRKLTLSSFRQLLWRCMLM